MCLCHTEVGTVSPLCILSGSIKQFISLTREGLDQLRVAHLSQQEVAEPTPIGFLAVKLEGVLTLLLQTRVVAPQVPVTAIHGCLLFRLCSTHSLFQPVADTG